jgi:ABC-type uncharacterized transport system substrate-binding protein
MPPFPERESSILAKLKKKRPDTVTALLEPRARGVSSATNNKSDQQTVAAVAPTPVGITNVNIALYVIIGLSEYFSSLETALH